MDLAAFPRLLSRTQGFRLGRPARILAAPGGSAVFFLRAASGEDPARGLHRLDLATGEETPLAEFGASDAEVSAQERSRRERSRDRSSGIVDYSASDDAGRFALTVAEGLHAFTPGSGSPVRLPARAPLSDATISPAGDAVAYVSGGELRLIGFDGDGDRALATPEGPDVTYGLPEHEAAESMGRLRGYWWSPDGSRLAVARVDNSPVQVWYLSDPADPSAAPSAHRYPPAGTDNAEVTLWIVSRDGARTEVTWDRGAFEYLVEVAWDAHGPLLVVQDRPQHRLRVLTADPATGETALLAEAVDPAWTQIVPGVPRRLPTGELVWTADEGDTRYLTVGGDAVTPPGLQVSEVFGLDGDVVTFGASAEATESHVWSWSRSEGLRQLTSGPARHSAVRGGGVTVISASTPTGFETITYGGEHPTRTIRSTIAPSPVTPRVTLLKAGRLDLRTGVLFPTGWSPGTPLPVLMDPYGGPAGQRAVASRDSYWASQWFADQGFAVIVADGRGTPGRGPAWEREIYLNRADHLLEDQIEALREVAARHPELDLTRVAVRGWSAGGYLAALAVLRRPDVFHAAVAGAPVTDHLMYDTHWQERFLGDPREDPGPYERASIIADAPNLTRPLMLIHGLRDDNVYPVHTMRLSAALLAAGRPHTVLPLPGASHMPPDTDLLTPQLLFLREALGIPAPQPAAESAAR